MIKWIFIIPTLLFISNETFTQINHDSLRGNQWLTGYHISDSIHNLGGTLWVFNGLNPPSFDPFSFTNDDYYLLESNSCINDTNGIFLLSTNGFKVFGRNHDLIPNGDSLSYGFFYTAFNGRDLRIHHGAMILPLPDHENIYYVFHQRMDTLPGSIMNYKPLELLYSIVKYTSADSNGVVISKNNRIILDTLSYGFEVTRHANGRDWWMIMPAFYDNKFYTVLFSPIGIQTVHVQSLQSPYSFIYSHSQQVTTTISPDGTTFVLASFQPDIPGTYSGGIIPIRVFNFDRCTGELFNERVFVDTVDKWPVINSIVSPNSQFLYVTYCLNDGFPDRESKAFQFDLASNNFGQTKQLVGEYDGYYDTLTCHVNHPLFNSLQIGPDKKIYIEGYNTRWVHVIENPDLPGVACNFQQRNILLPTFTCKGLPHLPNFRLGPLVGSICDSLSIGLPESEVDNAGFKVFPNPVAKTLVVQMSEINRDITTTFRIIDIAGREVESFMKDTEEFIIDVSMLSEGMFYLTAFIPEKGWVTKKFVICR